MRKLVPLSLVAAFIILAAGPAEAVRRSRPGANYSDERGSCQVTTPGEDVTIKCDEEGEHHEIRYQFRLPRDARHVRVKWDSDGGGDLSWGLNDRWGSQGRHLTAGKGFRSYGFFGVDVTIRRVEVRYWRT